MILEGMKSGCETDHERMVDVRMWIDRRSQRGDIMEVEVDQRLAAMYDEIVGVQVELDDRTRTASAMKVEHDTLEKKLDMATRAMISKQHANAKKQFPDKDPAQTDFFKVHVTNITKWKDFKLEPSLEAQKVFNRETEKLEVKWENMIKSMIDYAIEEESKPVEPGPTVEGDLDLDPDLMKELGTIVGESIDPLTNEASRFYMWKCTCNDRVSNITHNHAHDLDRIVLMALS